MPGENTGADMSEKRVWHHGRSMDMDEEERKRIREECNRMAEGENLPSGLNEINMMAVYAGPAQMENIGSMMMVYAGPVPMDKNPIGFMKMAEMMRAQSPDEGKENPGNGAAAEKKQIRKGIYCVCHGCGACVSTKFCPECGTPLANAEKYKDCLMCGTRLSATDKFCRECGALQDAEGAVKV